MSKVKVSVNDNGQVIHVSENNPEFGWVFVEQEAVQMENGWLRKNVRKARIMGKIEELQNMKFTAGFELPGKIVVIESLIPFNADNPDRNLKIAGQTGVICRVDDEPIYRQTYYTSNLNMCDEIITHNNSNEIKEVLAAQKAMTSLKTNSKEPSL